MFVVRAIETSGGLFAEGEIDRAVVDRERFLARIGDGRVGPR